MGLRQVLIYPVNFRHNQIKGYKMGKKKRYISLLFIFGLILNMDPIPFAGAETGEDNPSTESEVVIHSPIVDQLLSNIVEGEKEGDAKIKSENDAYLLQEKIDIAAEDIIRLTEELKNEQKYLEQLDLKYKSLNENADDTGTMAAQRGDKDDDIETDKYKGVQFNDAGIPETHRSEDKTQDKRQIIVGKGTESTAQGKEGGKESSLATDIGNYSSPFEMAEILYEMGKYEEAAIAYKSIRNDMVHERDFVWSQFQIGNCYRNQKKMDEAIKEYQTFINNYPDSFWAEQASWFIKDAKWWAEWFRRIRSDETPVLDESTTAQEE